MNLLVKIRNNCFNLEPQRSNELSTEDFLTKDPIAPEEQVFYEDCKEYYRQTERPLIIVGDEILNHDDGGTNSLEISVLKFGIDEDCSQFSLQNFLNTVCTLLQISTDDISVRKIESGSTIIETVLNDKLQTKEKQLKFQLIYQLLPNIDFQKELGKLKMFFMYMGSLVSFSKKIKYREEIQLNPQFNRIYAPNQTYWVGALNDGKDRGGQSYYCPIGWKRYSLYVGNDFDKKFKGWCIGYHGTKFAFGLSILLSGLKPAERNEHGTGVYATPSVNYAAHPRYSEVKLIESTHRKKFFNNAKYVQFVLECRIHPNDIKRRKETLDAAHTVIDTNIANDVIEWVVDNKDKDLVNFNDPDSSIICTGLMMRLTDDHPGLLPESQWWHEAHLCNYDKCCCIGIDLEELNSLKSAGTRCNIVYD